MSFFSIDVLNTKASLHFDSLYLTNNFYMSKLIWPREIQFYYLIVESVRQTGKQDNLTPGRQTNL